MAIDEELLGLLPHRPPFLFIDRVRAWSGERIVAEKTFVPGAYGTDGEAVLATSLVECLAQTVAAHQGYLARDAGGAAAEGLLVAVSTMRFTAEARCDAALVLHASITHHMPPYLVAQGKVEQDGRLLAEGGLRFWVGEPAR